MLDVHLVPVFERLDGLLLPGGVVVLVEGVHGVGAQLVADDRDEVHLAVVGVNHTSVGNGVRVSTNLNLNRLNEEHGAEDGLFVG
jgi:hypothetical protein